MDRKMNCKLHFPHFYAILFFDTKHTLYFTFIIFQKHEAYYGYFMSITVTTYDIATAIAGCVKDVPLVLVVRFEKNNFEIDIKCGIFENFCYY